MKIFTTLLLAALTTTAAFAADVMPAFNATLTVGKQSRFVLLGADGKASSWLSVGDIFEGYTIKSYDAKASALELEKDGKVSRISLAADATIGSAAAASTPATLADATAVLDKMNFEQMMEKTLAGVKKQQLALVDRIVGQMAKPGVDREALVDFQKRMVDTLMSALNASEMKGDIAKVYSEVFSKEELDGLGNFYSSPLGQTFSDKQPQLMEKMNQVMMPRMMAVMPKVQQMTQQFAMEQQARQAAAAAAAAPAAPAAPAPAPKP